MSKISERNVIRFMLKVGPWLAPFGTVYVVKRSVAIHFQLPDIIAWPTAAVIEVLGIGTIYLMLIMDDWNRKRSEKSRDPTARTGWARFLVILYILTTMVLVILLDVLPWLNRWALAVLPLVSVVAYLALSLFAEFEHMENEKRGKNKRTASGKNGNRGNYGDYLAEMARRNGEGPMSVDEVMDTFNVPQRTAYRWIAKERGMSKS